MKYGIELGRYSTEAFAKEERPPFFLFHEILNRTWPIFHRSICEGGKSPLFCFMKYGIELGRYSTEAFAKEERPPFFCFMKYGIERGRVSTEAFAKEERPPFFVL
jgi:hypothetical protein